MTGKNRKNRGQEIGCGFLLGIGVVIVMLLVINGLFVQAFFSVNLAGIDERLFQAAQFILPVLMIFLEFWCFDWFRFRHLARRERKENDRI
jgi:hypothetical protein